MNIKKRIWHMIKHKIIRSGVLLCCMSLYGCAINVDQQMFDVSNMKELTFNREGLEEVTFEEVPFNQTIELEENESIQPVSMSQSKMFVSVEEDTGRREAQFYNPYRTKYVYAYDLETNESNKIYDGRIENHVYDVVSVDDVSYILVDVYDEEDVRNVNYEVIQINGNNTEVLKTGKSDYFKPKIIPLKQPVLMIPVIEENDKYWDKYPVQLLEFYDVTNNGLVKKEIDLDDHYQLLGMDCAWNDDTFVLFLMNTDTETAEFAMIDGDKVRYVPFPKECRLYNFSMIGNNLFVTSEDVSSGMDVAIVYDLEDQTIYKGEMDRVFMMESVPNRDAVIANRTSGGNQYCELFTYKSGEIMKKGTKVLDVFEPHWVLEFVNGNDIYVYIENNELSKGETHLYKLSDF